MLVLRAGEGEERVDLPPFCCNKTLYDVNNGGTIYQEVQYETLPKTSLNLSREQFDTHKVRISTAPLGMHTAIPTFLTQSEGCRRSPFLSTSSAPSAILTVSAPRCQNFATSTWFSSWGRRSQRRPNQSNKGVGWWGTTDVFLEAKPCCTAKTAWAGALSWSSVVRAPFVWPSQPDVLPKPPQNVAGELELTFCPERTNSLRIIPSASKNQFRIDLILLFTCRSLFGQGVLSTEWHLTVYLYRRIGEFMFDLNSCQRHPLRHRYMLNMVECLRVAWLRDISMSTSSCRWSNRWSRRR